MLPRQTKHTTSGSPPVVVLCVGSGPVSTQAVWRALPSVRVPTPAAYDPVVDDRHPVRYVGHRLGPRRGQRTAALTSLLLDVAGVALLVVFAIGRPLYMAVLVAGGLGTLFFGFAALTSVGAARVGAGLATLGASGVVVAGTVVRLIQLDGVRWSGPFGVLCLVVGVVLGRYALRVPPPSGSRVWAVPTDGPTTSSAVLIANPRSGGGKVLDFDLAEVGRDHGVEVVVMADGDDLRRLALDAVTRGADALGMAGGDGSLAVVAQVAVDHDLPFVCVPAGTRNHYAGDLGLDRADPARAMAAFVRGEEHRLDYATVNGRMFLNNVSLGAYAAAVEHPEYRDAKLETTLGVMPEMVAKGGPWFDLHLDVPGDGHWDAAALVQVSNGVYETAGSAFGRRMDLDHGELGVIAVDVNHVGDLVAITILAAARHPELSAGVWPWSTDRLRVDSDQMEIGAGVDGEHVRLTPPLVFEVVPRGLRVLVPEGAPVGLARQHLGARGTMNGLFEVAFNLGSHDEDE